MHPFTQNASKIFWGAGTAPFPDFTRTGEGHIPPHTLLLQRLRCLDSARPGRFRRLIPPNQNPGYAPDRGLQDRYHSYLFCYLLNLVLLKFTFIRSTLTSQ